MVVVNEHARLVSRQKVHALSHLPGLINVALALGPAVYVGAGVGRVGEHHVDSVVGGGYPPDLGGREATVWEEQLLLQEPEQVLRAEPNSKKRWKTLPMALATASSGSKSISPSSSPQTRPTGNPLRNSPRSALFRMPPFKRARRTCSSASYAAPAVMPHAVSFSFVS